MREEQPHGILKRRERSASPLLGELDNPAIHRSSLHLDLGPESLLDLPAEKDVQCELQGECYW